MTKDPVTVAPGETLGAARQKMRECHFRRLPVVARGKLVGIVTDGDLRLHCENLDTIPVERAMTRKVVTIAPSTTVEDAARKLLEHRISGLPVVDGDRLVGIVTTSDVLCGRGRSAEHTRAVSWSRTIEAPAITR
jgi:acetoin utilization protein AcuB